MGKQAEINTSIALEVMENELECIKRNGKCDRHCGIDNKILIKVYEWLVISLKVAKELEEQEKYREDVMAINDKWLISEKIDMREGIFKVE